MLHRNKVKKLAQPGLVIMGILLIASNLRSPITGIGPILDFISKDLALTATQAGMITTVPLLAFAFFSPLSSSLARKVGLESSLMMALIAITIGIAIRSLGSSQMLFLGTSVIGIGIAIGNVLLPSLLKRDFPKQVTTLTAIYVLVMGVGSSISSSIAIPMLHFADSLHITVIPNWSISLASIVIFPIIAIVIWLPQLKNRTVPTADTAEIDSDRYIWRTPAAWQVTIFLGLNSFIMYIFIAWLPSILIDSGYSEHQAGYLHGILQLATAVPALVLIPLMAKFKDKRLLSGGMGVLAFVGIRTHDAHQAAVLSGMAQCMGYLLAATGPICFGLLHEATGSWKLPLIMCLVACIAWIGIAMFAGLPHIINKEGKAHLASK